jgi:hypothetical protein
MTASRSSSAGTARRPWPSPTATAHGCTGYPPPRTSRPRHLPKAPGPEPVAAGAGGADPRTIDAIGRDAFRSDALATAGPDDRKPSGGYLSRAEQLIADAVGRAGLVFGGRLPDEFLGTEASHDRDPPHVVIDVSGLGISGYDAADWLREHELLDYLRTGLVAGRQFPDPADPSLNTIRVVSQP